MTNPFIPFGTAHLAAIALAVIVPVLLALLGRLSGRIAAIVRWLFAGELVAMYLLWFWLLFEGVVGNVLPMHLCDWAAIAAIATLIVPNQKSYELAYFWTFSGTLQATLTPELALGWPDLRFVIFFGFHCGVIAAVLYMTLGMGLRPYLKSIPRVVAWTVFYGIAAGFMDWATGANYGFLARQARQSFRARSALAMALVHRRACADRTGLHPDPVCAVLHRRTGSLSRGATRRSRQSRRSPSRTMCLRNRPS